MHYASDIAPLDCLRLAADESRRVVERCGPQDLERPSPCEQWTVADLIAHLDAGNRLFAAALRGEHAEPDRPAAPGGPTTGYGAGVDELVRAFTADGALARTVHVPFGTVPGAFALHLRITELLVHGWDLATATGQIFQVPDSVAAQELVFTTGALTQLPAGRSPFGPPCEAPAGASSLDRLAALLGRTVAR